MNDQVALFTSEVTRVASVNDRQAPAWWTLADAKGNEADVGTWMRSVLLSPACPVARDSDSRKE